MAKNKLICIVGMCGAGKSEVSEYLMKKRDFGYVRFGQITMDRIKELGLPVNEASEKEVREGFRKEHGMAAYAVVNIPKFDELLESGDVIGDGLYSWEEYLVLKEKYTEQMVVLAVFAPPRDRYKRLQNRSKRHQDDDNLKYRNFTSKEAATRDQAEIENLHKAGPIAMADYTINNSASFVGMYKQIDDILDEVFGLKENL